MIEIIAIIGLLLVVGLQSYLIIMILNRSDKRESDLLNRIMTRNYETYVQAEVLKEPKPLTPEEIYEQQIERGIPV
jgi:hypothetical protein